MSETTPPTDPSATDPTTPAPKKKRKLWKWLLGGVVVLILAVGLLVLLAPMIISTGAVRNIVVGKINDNLNGKVEIADWSVQWTGGVSVTGVRVFDETNAQIAELKSFSTQLSLLDAAKGKIHLGKTVVDGLNFNARQDQDGQLNFAKLVKSDPDAPKTDMAPAGDDQPAAEAGQPGEPIELSGELVLSNISGTFEQPGQPTLHITSLNGGAVIKSLNDPIDHNLDVALRVQDKTAGKVALKGTASVRDGDVNNLAVNDTLTLDGIDFDGLRALIPASAGVELRRGVTNGTLSLVVADGRSATLSGNITGKDYEITGEALKGDTFKTSELSVTIPPIVVAMPNGPADTAAMTVKTGGGTLEPVAIQWDQGSVTASADAALAALMNLAANKPPGSAGKVNLAVDINVAALAKMLPNTLSIPSDVTLNSGKLQERIELAIAPEQAAFSVVTDIKDVAGTNAGKAVSLQPINVTLKGSARGSDQAMPDLRDLSLDLTSGFATANFKAPTLSQLGGKAQADLKKLQDELGQIIDFQGKTLAGTFVMNIATQGDPQKLSTPAPAKLDVTLSNVVVTGVAEEPIRLERFIATVDSTLNATDEGALQSIDKTTITLKNYQGQAETLDALIKDVAVTLGEAMTAKWTVDYITADVGKLQDDLKPFVKQLQTGRLDVGKVTLKLAGEMTQAGETMTASVRNLSVTESGNLFALTQPEGDVLSVKMFAPSEGAGTLQAAGKLAVAADLKRGHAVARAFQATATVNGKQPEIVSGKLNGTVEMATLDQTGLKLGGQFKITDLSIDTGTGETARQEITLALASTAATDFSSIKDTTVDFAGPFGTVKLENVAVDLPPAPEGGQGTVLPVIHGARLTVNVTDMGPLDSLRSAFSPAPPPPATQPVRVPRGSLTLAADVKQVGREIVLDITELTGSEELRLQQGDGIYKVRPFTNKNPVQIKVSLSGNSAQPLEEQIKQIHVSTLNLDLGIATLKSDKGLLITSPLGNEPVPSGNITLAARIQDLTEIPEALAKKNKGELYPYEGDLLLTQEFKKTGDHLAVDGNIGVTGLKVYQDGKPVVDEPQVVIANKILADLAKKNLTITQVLVDMPKSQALNVNITGAINDWEKTRQFENLVVTLAGDWAKLWTIVHPMLGKDADGKDPYEDLVVAGTFKDRKITVGGSMPAGLDGPAATQHLTAQGSIGIEKVVWPSYGITEASNLEVPFTLKDNQLVTALPDQPYTPMTVNGGTVDIHNIRYTLTDPPRLYIEPNKQVVKGVSLTASMTQKLGELFKNPLFLNAKEASGTLDLTVIECNGFLASGKAMEKVPENQAPLKVVYSINNFRTLNEFATLLGQQIDKDDQSTGNDLQGSIKDATVVLQGGEVQQDTTLLLGQRQLPVRLAGGIDLQSLALKNFIMNLPPTMLKQVTKDKNVVKYLPAGVNVALRGTATSPQFDFGNTIQTMIRDATQKAIADNLLGGGKKDDKAQPGDQGKKSDDPIGALEDIFGKKKKDDKKKK